MSYNQRLAQCVKELKPSSNSSNNIPILGGRPARTVYKGSITNKLGYETKFAISAKDGYISKTLDNNEKWVPFAEYTEMDTPEFLAFIKIKDKPSIIVKGEVEFRDRLADNACFKFANGPIRDFDHTFKSEDYANRRITGDDSAYTWRENQKPFTKTRVPITVDEC